MEQERVSRLAQIVTVRWRQLPESGDAESLEQVMSGASQVLLHYLQEFGDIAEVDITPLCWMDLHPVVADKHPAR